jgi:hypothetical protein
MAARGAVSVGVGVLCSMPGLHCCAARSTLNLERNLMRAIPPGTKGSFALVVSPAHLANRFKDATLAAVLATPVMIMTMENAALNSRTSSGVRAADASLWAT